MYYINNLLCSLLKFAAFSLEFNKKKHLTKLLFCKSRYFVKKKQEIFFYKKDFLLFCFSLLLNFN